MRLSPSGERFERLFCFAQFYNVLQPSGRVSRQEQLELSQGFDQTREKQSRRSRQKRPLL
jgi:hypothetical protein